MECKKYEIIKDGGRKRIRSLRDFTVQDRRVCVGDLGGYVYDEKTLAQKGNAWIFSGSLEYPGVRVMDGAIVDMGNNLPKSYARPKRVIISGNSRIMGAISFETQLSEVAQTPAMFEQGSYRGVVGNVPVKIGGSTRVRIPVPLFAGTKGTVAITSTAYEARLISLDEAGIVVSASAWTAGGPKVTLTSIAPYILVEVRKVGDLSISPADVTAAGVSIWKATESQINVFNSSIVPVYNGSVEKANNIFRFLVSGTPASPTTANLRNSYIRVECVYNDTNSCAFNADFTKVNHNMVMKAGVYTYVSGVFRNTNMNSQASVSGGIFEKRLFDVSDCPNFEFSTVTFPDLANMVASGKTFYFRNCNMPVGSAIHYYDPKVNVWVNIDFTKAMADLGKTAFKRTTIVSSNVQGMYRVRGNDSLSLGMLVQDASSFVAASITKLFGSYDSVIYKDCTLTGLFNIIGCNVFGGTLGGASKITNTTETAMVIDGSFRIEGNAQVTDTPLKGTGYIGGNAELKNGKVEGYIYMQDNAKYIPAVAANPSIIRRLIMSGNAKVLKQRDAASGLMNLVMSDNAVLDAAIGFVGDLIMMGDSRIVRADKNSAATIYGKLVLKDRARVEGTASVDIRGEITLVGNFAASGAKTIYGKRVISDVSQIAVVGAPPTKKTW